MYKWAARWNVPPQAMTELMQVFGVDTDPKKTAPKTSEARVMSEVRLEATQKGLRAWRNNVGAFYARDGRFIRYGLANDSKAVNKRTKSSDLIMCRPVLIGPQHLGTIIGRLTVREIKKSNWVYKPVFMHFYFL